MKAAVAPAPVVAVDPYAATYQEAKTLIEQWKGDVWRLQQARALMMSVLEKDRGYAPAYVCIARCELLAGYQSGHNYDPEAATRAYKVVHHALKLDPRLFDGRITAGYVSAAQRDLDAARNEADLAEEIRPGTNDVRMLRGHVARLEGQFDEMERLANEVLQHDPSPRERVSANEDIIEYAYANKLPERQEAAYREIVRLEPESAWAHGNFASFLYSRGRYDESIAEGEKAVALMAYPLAVQYLAKAYLAKAEQLWNEGQFDASVKVVERMGSLAGDDARVQFAVGTMAERAAIRSHDPALRSRALSAFRKALQLDPQMTDARDAVARLEKLR